MRSIVLAPFVFLLFFAQQAFSQEVYYRITSGDSVLTFTNNSPMTDKMLQVIAERTFMQPFAANTVNSNNYQVHVVKNIVWQGLQVTQYDYVPLTADRFRQVLWVYGYTIVKMEVYDTADKLMFSGAYLGAENMPQMPAPAPQPALASAESFTFYGFIPVRKETSKDGLVRMLFSDGLNRFSIFKEPAKQDDRQDRQVVYANNVYHTTVGEHTYTVVGGLSFEKMQEALEMFIKSEKAL